MRFDVLQSDISHRGIVYRRSAFSRRLRDFAKRRLHPSLWQYLRHWSVAVQSFSDVIFFAALSV